MQLNSKPSLNKFYSFVILSGLTVLAIAIARGKLFPIRLPKIDSASQPQASDPNAVVLIEPKRRATLPNFTKQDTQSIVFPGTRISEAQLQTTRIPYLPAKAEKLTVTELQLARQAWQYFENNWHESSGLVNSADGFTSVTMWEQGTAIAAVVAAYELELIEEEEFTSKIERMLATLGQLYLYNDELPNKVYNSKSLIPVNYSRLDSPAAIGWSAIDLGRMALWLKIIASKYPQFKPQAETVWQSWNVQRLTRDGNLFATSVINKREQYSQEGRLGYENYAAWGLKLWGMSVDKALDYQDKVAFVSLYGVDIPYDLRDIHNSRHNNYVLSEPYFLDGIETGFQALPKVYSDRILAAQEARYQATGQLTALTSGNLDRFPYFVNNTLYVNGQPWKTITGIGENYQHLRFLSSQAAISWHMLYKTEYTQKLFDLVENKLVTQDGLYNGFYETLNQPNQALTANNNGIILEALLYKQLGQPLFVWATQDQ